MTSEEIEQLLAKGEKSLRREDLVAPVLTWTFCAGSMVIGVLFESMEELLFAIFLVFVSLAVSSGHRATARGLKTRRAQLLWEYLTRTAFAPRFGASTSKLAREIGDLYQGDPRGEVLPLSQSIRLVNTHHKQQARLQIVGARLRELEAIGVALRQTTEQLRDLGETLESGEARLQALRDDENALRTLSAQIEASCRRLELILIEARKAGQMQQLHREIGDLSLEAGNSSASSSSLSVSSVVPESLFDVERQIAREVETYLRLERDSDRHLREG